MEQPRYRAVPGGGSGGAAWNGTCGRPRGATGATTPGATGGDRSGERDPRVPNPGDVPEPRVPNPGVPSPGDVPNPGDVPEPRVPNPGVPNPGVPSPGVPNPGDVPEPRVPNPGNVPNPGDVPEPRVPSPGVPNPGVPSPGVPNPRDVPNPRFPTPESVASPGSVPNTRSVTNPRNVPNPAGTASPGSVTNPGGVHSPGNVPNPRNVTSPGGVPSPGNVPNSGSVTNPRNVPSPEGVLSPGSVTNPGDVPTPAGVASPGAIPNTGSVPSPDSVPNTGSVPNPGGAPSPDTVPTPGGRCRCRGPPAAPPSPTRDIPCGLGCRHRAAPEGTGDTRRARRRPRQRHDEPDSELGDSERGQRASLRVARAGVALCLRLLGALLALLLLLLLLILGGLRSSLRRGSAGLRRCRELLGERLRRRPSRSAGDGEQEVTRLVAMAQVAEEELDPFRVLGVEPTASDAELRRAYRRLAVLVHPDKSRDPRAEAAFKVLRAGWERVSSPERRREYETKQLAQGELARALGAFLGRLQEELRDAMDAMGCTRCGGRHRRFPLDRDPRAARHCAECGAWHAAEEGDLWAESSLLGLKVTYLARMDGHVYDVTEWAGCQRVAISPDSHRVPYHLSFGARTATPAGRHRAPPKGSPPSPSEIQEFLARVFQGNPSSGEAGGAFPTPPGAAGPPQGPPQAQGGAPRGDTKHKRRKKGRRPLPR